MNPLGGANIGPGAIICISLLQVQQRMLHTKYLSSRPNSFLQEDFLNDSYKVYIKLSDPVRDQY